MRYSLPESMRKTDYDEDTYYQMVERDLKPLILITLKAEELIADYALVKTEDLWDEEFDQVVRALFFEQGDRESSSPTSSVPVQVGVIASTRLQSEGVWRRMKGWWSDCIDFEPRRGVSYCLHVVVFLENGVIGWRDLMIHPADRE